MQISTRKDKKYMIYVPECGKYIHFGAKGMSDFTIHKDEKRRIRYLKRHYNIFNKNGVRVINDICSPSYYSARILWGYNPSKDDKFLI